MIHGVFKNNIYFLDTLNDMRDISHNGHKQFAYFAFQIY